MWNDIYGSYAPAFTLNIQGVPFRCLQVPRIICWWGFTLKEPASHGLYSKTQSTLSYSFKKVLPLHSCSWNPFPGKTLQTLIAISCYKGSVPLSFLFLHFYNLLCLYPSHTFIII